jgi:hypothetical protein
MDIAERLIDKKLGIFEGWTPHPSQKGAWSADLSDYEGHVKSTGNQPRCPNCRQSISNQTAWRNRYGSTAHTDREGDITHWQFSHPCGAKLTVFND